MHRLLAVKVADAQTYLEGNQPYQILGQGLTLIFNPPKVAMKVALFCIFHDYVKALFLHERIVVLHDMRMIL